MTEPNEYRAKAKFIFAEMCSTIPYNRQIENLAGYLKSSEKAAIKQAEAKGMLKAYDKCLDEIETSIIVVKTSYNSVLIYKEDLHSGILYLKKEATDKAREGK